MKFAYSQVHHRGTMKGDTVPNKGLLFTKIRININQHCRVKRTLQKQNKQKQMQRELMRKCCQPDRCPRLYSLGRNGCAHPKHFQSLSQSAEWSEPVMVTVVTLSCGKVGQVSACLEYAAWGVVKNCTWLQPCPRCSSFLWHFCSTRNFFSARSFRQIRQKWVFASFLSNFCQICQTTTSFNLIPFSQLPVKYSLSLSQSRCETRLSLFEWLCALSCDWSSCVCVYTIPMYRFVWGHSLIIQSTFSRFAHLL